MKKIPMRKCTGCMEMKDKRELIRVVRAPSGEDENSPVQISLDTTGKKPGRGAYVCKNAECLEKAQKARKLERSLSCKIPAEIYQALKAELEQAVQ